MFLHSRGTFVLTHLTYVVVTRVMLTDKWRISSDAEIILNISLVIYDVRMCEKTKLNKSKY